MHEARSTIYSQYLFGVIPAFPSLLFGMLLIWQQGLSVLTVCIAFIMIASGVLSGSFLWIWHNDLLNRRNNQQLQKSKHELNKLMAYTTELESMLQKVMPKIDEQVVTARELTEKEISMLIGRFSAMLNELQQIIDFASQDSKKPFPNRNVKNTAEKIRTEIDSVLQSLQFQDRVSQILTQVRDNLNYLKKTVDKIQLQGSDRSQDMIKVEAMLASIQNKYESVSPVSKNMPSDDAVNELTFF